MWDVCPATRPSRGRGPPSRRRNGFRQGPHRLQRNMGLSEKPTKIYSTKCRPKGHFYPRPHRVRGTSPPARTPIGTTFSIPRWLFAYVDEKSSLMACMEHTFPILRPPKAQDGTYVSDISLHTMSLHRVHENYPDKPLYLCSCIRCAVHVSLTDDTLRLTELHRRKRFKLNNACMHTNV